MTKLINAIIQLVRMAHYGAPDEFENGEEEFENAEGNDEQQIHLIPKIADNGLVNLRAESRNRISGETRQSY